MFPARAARPALARDRDAGAQARAAAAAGSRGAVRGGDVACLLGEVARLMLKGLERLGVQSWTLDVGGAVGAASDLPPLPDRAPPPRPRCSSM